MTDFFKPKDPDNTTLQEYLDQMKDIIDPELSAILAQRLQTAGYSLYKNGFKNNTHMYVLNSILPRSEYSVFICFEDKFELSSYKETFIKTVITETDKYIEVQGLFAKVKTNTKQKSYYLDFKFNPTRIVFFKKSQKLYLDLDSTRSKTNYLTNTKTPFDRKGLKNFTTYSTEEFDNKVCEYLKSIGSEKTDVFEYLTESFYSLGNVKKFNNPFWIKYPYLFNCLTKDVRHIQKHFRKNQSYSDKLFKGILLQNKYKEDILFNLINNKKKYESKLGKLSVKKLNKILLNTPTHVLTNISAFNTINITNTLQGNYDDL